MAVSHWRGPPVSSYWTWNCRRHLRSPCGHLTGPCGAEVPTGAESLPTSTGVPTNEKSTRTRRSLAVVSTTCGIGRGKPRSAQSSRNRRSNQLCTPRVISLPSITVSSAGIPYRPLDRNDGDAAVQSRLGGRVVSEGAIECGGERLSAEASERDRSDRRSTVIVGMPGHECRRSPAARTSYGCNDLDARSTGRVRSSRETAAPGRNRRVRATPLPCAPTPRRLGRSRARGRRDRRAESPR